MEESPLVTIGLTCFNCERTIERALKSAINQDWENKEKLEKAVSFQKTIEEILFR